MAGTYLENAPSWENKVDIEAVSKRCESIDSEAIDIDNYFTKEEMAKMCDLEKLRYKNMKRNYLLMLEFGIPIKRPPFMTAKTAKKRMMKRAAKLDKADPDVDWTPQVEKQPRRKSARERIPVAKWTPPLQLLRVEREELPLKKDRQKREEEKAAEELKKETPVRKRKSVPSSTVVRDEWKRYSSTEVDGARSKMLKTLMDRKPAEKSADTHVATEAVDSKTDNESKSDSTARYPKREGAQKDYTCVEVPDDDYFLYCDECNMEYPDDCPIHGPLVIIEDKKVTGKDRNRANHTLPDGLAITPSKIKGAGLGVWTEKRFAKNTRFGPYVGVRLTIEEQDEAHKTGYSWQLNESDLPSHFIDASKKSTSNWLRYVNCARNEEEQNLVAYQYRGEIYYKTIRPIMPYCELLVWYGDEYGKELGIKKVKLTSTAEKTTEVQSKCDRNISSTASELLCCKNACPRILKKVKRDLSKSDVSKIDVRTKHDEKDSMKYTVDLYKSLLIELHSSSTTQSVTSADNVTMSVTTHDKIPVEITTNTDKLSEYNFDSLNERFTKLSTVVNNVYTDSNKLLCLSDDIISQLTSTIAASMTSSGQREQCSGCTRKVVLRVDNEKDVKNHVKRGTSDRRHGDVKRQRCERSFTTKSGLKQPEQIHTGEKPYKCQHCDARFTTNSNLVTHVRIHTGEKPYKCQHCDARFTQNSSLMPHVRIHTGEKPYKCQHCDARFTMKHHLVKHVRIHTGEKPYKCQHCDARFTTNSYLVTHVRIHTGEKPYKCQHCDAGFTQNGNLVKHVRIHTGEKPYKCQHCDARYSDNSSLRHHVRRHHS